MPKTRCSGRQAGPNIDVYTVAMPTRDAHDGTAVRAAGIPVAIPNSVHLATPAAMQPTPLKHSSCLGIDRI